MILSILIADDRPERIAEVGFTAVEEIEMDAEPQYRRPTNREEMEYHLRWIGLLPRGWGVVLVRPA